MVNLIDYMKNSNHLVKQYSYQLNSNMNNTVFLRNYKLHEINDPRGDNSIKKTQCPVCCRVTDKFITLRFVSTRSSKCAHVHFQLNKYFNPSPNILISRL